MHILSPTALQKKKLKEMTLRLFPEYGYLKYCSHGVISLSKSFWHSLFKRTYIHITELCTVHIPERLVELENKTAQEYEGKLPYQRVYNKYSHVVLDLLHLRASKVIDYLYDEYTNVKYGIHKVYYVKNNILPERSYTLSEVLFTKKSDSLVLSRLSNVHIKEALKHWKDTVFVLNHPALLSQTLDMWFRQEIKEQLRRINVRIAYT